MTLWRPTRARMDWAEGARRPSPGCRRHLERHRHRLRKLDPVGRFARRLHPSARHPRSSGGETITPFHGAGARGLDGALHFLATTEARSARSKRRCRSRAVLGSSTHGPACSAPCDRRCELGLGDARAHWAPPSERAPSSRSNRAYPRSATPVLLSLVKAVGVPALTVAGGLKLVESSRVRDAVHGRWRRSTPG